MADQTQEEKDLQVFHQTDIKGKMPKNGYEVEKAKFDKKGNLIDEAEAKRQERQRQILLGKIKPEPEDYEDPNFADARTNPETRLIPSGQATYDELKDDFETKSTAEQKAEETGQENIEDDDLEKEVEETKAESDETVNADTFEKSPALNPLTDGGGEKSEQMETAIEKVEEESSGEEKTEVDTSAESSQKLSESKKKNR